jgi:crotonobetainyl-CoA:carnitine CoA-transferase CaiB-like acyl-CoA transferase
MPATPLAGVRVLEFSHTVMGPTAGLVFAELGADVIKVEPAPKGDHTRGLGGFGAGVFAAFNRNKRGLAVDLKRKEGQRVIHRLVPTAEFLICKRRRVYIGAISETATRRFIGNNAKVGTTPSGPSS